MDKTAFENMNLNEFISKTVDNLSVEMHKALVKCLLKDIIDIYKGLYCTYWVYTNEMNKLNSYIDYSYNYNKYDYKINFVYIPKHIILEEFAFNYICDLSRKNK